MHLLHEVNEDNVSNLAGRRIGRRPRDRQCLNRRLHIMHPQDMGPHQRSMNGTPYRAVNPFRRHFLTG